MINNISKKKVLILTFLIFSLKVQFVLGQSFTDVHSDHWAHKHISELSQNGIVGGFPDATFRPNDSVSKVQTIVMIYNLMNKVEDIVDIEGIVRRYENVLNSVGVNINAPWASRAISYALEEEILTVNELNNFFSQGAQTFATREDVAMFLARALNGSGDYSKVIVLPYIDSELIRASNIRYIDFLLNKGILNAKGDGHGRFNGSNTISRAEIASMLSHSFEYILGEKEEKSEKNNQNIEDGKELKEELQSIKTGSIGFLDSNSVLVQFDNLETKLFKRNPNVEVIINGQKSLFSELTLKQEVTVTIKGEDTLLRIEATSFVPDIEGTLNAITPNVGFDLIVLRNSTTNNIQTLKAYERTKVQLDGVSVSLKELKAGDIIKLKLNGQDAVEIVATSKIKTYQGTLQEHVESLEKPVLRLLINGEIKTIEAKSDVKVRRNGVSNLVTNLKIGDNLIITTEYEKATNIQATSVITRKTGKIDGINIFRDSSSIDIINNNEIETYNIDSSISIKVNGLEKDLYDLRVDQIIEIIIENDEVIAIESRDDLNKTQINGTISSINTASKNIVIEYLDRSTNKIALKTIHYTNNTRMTSSLAQVPISINALRVNDQVFVVGEEKSNRFTADRIVLID